MGSPRWQLLGSIRREIRDRLFLEQNNKLLLLKDLAALENQHYFRAGLFFGKFTLLHASWLLWESRFMRKKYPFHKKKLTGDLSCVCE